MISLLNTSVFTYFLSLSPEYWVSQNWVCAWEREREQPPLLGWHYKSLNARYTEGSLKKMADLSDSEMAKLIEPYQSLENLYSINMQEYHDRDKQWESHLYIAVVMGNGQDEKTKSKLKRICSSYTRERNVLKESRKSGASTDYVRTPKWTWWTCSCALCMFSISAMPLLSSHPKVALCSWQDMKFQVLHPNEQNPKSTEHSNDASELQKWISSSSS